MRTAGVDEAGRGPVLGPLVVAAVLVEDEAPLRELGVKDSKKLTPVKREQLAPQILEVCVRAEIRVITPGELNHRMPSTNLNVIEVEAFAELLDRLAPEHAILDACDVNAERFGHNVHALLKHARCRVSAYHEADAHHAVVAAASILAKTHRDRLMQELRDQHGDCGSGYSHDARTQGFLKQWVDAHDALPPFARHHWETCKRLLRRDRSLLEFLDTPTPKPVAKKPAKKAAAQKKAATKRRKA